MRLFLSYATVDEPYCLYIAEQLAPAHDAWFDRGLTGGMQWQEQIQSKIDEADVFLALLTNESLASRYCREELERALTRGKPIVPVRLRANAKLPAVLEHLQLVDLSQDPQDLSDLLVSLAIIERQIQGTTTTLSSSIRVRVRLIASRALRIRAERIRQQLDRAGYEASLQTLPADESAETLSTPDCCVYFLTRDALTDPLFATSVLSAVDASLPLIPLYVESLAGNSMAPALQRLVRMPGLRLTASELTREDLDRLEDLIVGNTAASTAVDGKDVSLAPVPGSYGAASHPPAPTGLILGPGASSESERLRAALVRDLSPRTPDHHVPDDLTYYQLLSLHARRYGKAALREQIEAREEGSRQELSGAVAEALAFRPGLVLSTVPSLAVARALSDYGYSLVRRPDDLPQSLTAGNMYAILFSGPPITENSILTTEDLAGGGLSAWLAGPLLPRLLATASVIFLGFDDDLQDLQLVASSLLGGLDRRTERAITLLPEPAAAQSPTAILPTEVMPLRNGTLPPAVVRIISSPQPESNEAPRPYPARSSRPYKFLDYFEEADQTIFFGRERESAQLMAKVETSRLVLLYGLSGSGKTSLLNAGLMPRARAAGYTIAKRRVSQNPLSAIRSSIEEALESAGVPAEPGSTIEELARILAKRRIRLLIIVDQFEELFVHHNDAVIDEFARGLSTIISSQHAKIKLLLSLREDYLPAVATLDKFVPEIFHNYMRLRSLTESQALDAIVEPARAYGLSLDEGLPDRIVTDLGATAVEGPQLQIVCDRLFDMADGGMLNNADYEAAGRARGILSGYTDEVLLRFASDQRSLVRRLLKFLVTLHGTKDSITMHTLVVRLANNPTEVREIVATLIQYRLVRPVEGPSGPSLELSHDYLADEIRGWLADTEIQERAALALLTQELEAFRAHGTAITRERFQIVDAQRGSVDLLMTPEEMAFCLISSLTTKQSMKEWLDVNQGNVEAARLLAQALRGELSDIYVDQYFAYAAGVLGIADLRQPALHLLEARGNPALYGLLDRMATWSRADQRTFASEARAAIEARGKARMIWVEGGSCTVGTDTAEVNELVKVYEIDPSRLGGESPSRRMEMGGFWIDRFPVTNEEYEEFDNTHAYARDAHDHPAVNLSFSHASAYADWWGKSIPTEYEWELAARGVDGRRYPWGDSWDPQRCNTEESGPGESTPVDAYPEGVSPMGCWDMAGNVWEWTDSWFDERLQLKVCKGGGWAADKLWARCAARHRSYRSSQFHLVGFRCVLHPDRRSADIVA